MMRMYKRVDVLCCDRIKGMHGDESELRETADGQRLKTFQPAQGYRSVRSRSLMMKRFDVVRSEARQTIGQVFVFFY